ncbi:TRFM protein, partial [Amia calva]|nr:TRFM protein [Amia calva]
MRKCTAMAESFQRASIRPELQCVEGTSEMNCAAMLASNNADAVSLSGKGMFNAGKQNKFKSAAGEADDKEYDTSYYTVAVVKKSNLEININNLKGKKSCHTGLGRTAGWDMPIGYLIDSGRMSVMSCNILKGVSDFFSASCVPGANSPNSPESLCQLCIGDENGQSKCSSSAAERYFSYSGAFRCLAEGAGDVAFIKHTTVKENTDGMNTDAWARLLHSTDYELLCRDGSRVSVNEYKRCHLVKVPTRGVIVREGVSTAEVFSMLNEGLKKSGFPMFQSSIYGGTNLMFSDSTTNFLRTESENYVDWLGLGYINALKSMQCTTESVPQTLRWCIQTHGELLKCQKMAESFNKKQLTPPIQCVSGDSYEDCMKKIKNKDADAITLDGGFIYTAGKTYGLVPAAGESYTEGSSDSSYYAVAVVKRSVTDSFSFSGMKGRRSCHTGYGRTAGWNLPVGVLVERGMIRPQRCQFAQAVGDFFSASCVPGANQPGFPANLCEQCIGDTSGNHKCEPQNTERFYGYNGAFRCLADGKGEIAFVKHTTVFDNTDGNNMEPWATSLRSQNFQLLCLNGARAEVSQYAHCNLARVPSHAVMVHPDTDINVVYGLLDKAQEFFGADNNTNGFRMFDSSDFEGTDLIFKDSTIRMTGVGEKKNYSSWLGTNYMNSLKVLECSSAGRFLWLR